MTGASHEGFVRAVDATSSARGAQRRLDESRRRRGLDASEYTSAGEFSSLQQARKLGELEQAAAAAATARQGEAREDLERLKGERAGA